MKAEEIHLTDWLRILMGEFPASFFVEVILRTTFLFLLLIVSMRVLGRRMASMLDMHELSVLVALAAAIGIPLQSPERGLLPALVVCIAVVGIQKTIFMWGFKKKSIELFIHGDIAILIMDGVIDLAVLKKTLITKNRLLAQLRNEGIRNLGEVKRLYMETTGNFTTIKCTEPFPGLSILPDEDPEFKKQALKTIEGVYACKICGNTEESVDLPDHQCPKCRFQKWEHAVLSVKQ